MARALLGAVAGLAGTLAMTAAMRRMHARLPRAERYPLPPREILESLDTAAARGRSDRVAGATLGFHLAFGAVAGAVYAAGTARPAIASGVRFGALVWGASYFAALPLAGILTNAARHPLRRNALMLAAHAVWGGVTAATLREMDAATADIFSGGALLDVPADRPSRSPGAVGRRAASPGRPSLR